MCAGSARGKDPGRQFKHVALSQAQSSMARKRYLLSTAEERVEWGRRGEAFFKVGKDLTKREMQLMLRSHSRGLGTGSDSTPIPSRENNHLHRGKPEGLYPSKASVVVGTPLQPGRWISQRNPEHSDIQQANKTYSQRVLFLTIFNDVSLNYWPTPTAAASLFLIVDFMFFEL